MKDNSKTNTLLLTVIGVATLLVAVIGATFAYFTAQISGSETTSTVKMNAGTLSINYENGNAIESTTEFEPTKAAVECPDKKPNETAGYYCDQAQYTPVGIKTFTLTGNNSTPVGDGMKMPYKLQLVVTANGFTAGTLKYTLSGSSTGTGDSVVSTDTWKDIPAGANTVDLGDGYFMPGNNVKHSYTLNVYFPDNHANQDDNKEKVFKAKVNITTSEIAKK